MWKISHSVFIFYFTVISVFSVFSAIENFQQDDNVQLSNEVLKNYWKKEFYAMKVQMKHEKENYQNKLQKTVKEVRSIIQNYQGKVEEDMNDDKNQLKNTTSLQTDILLTLNMELLNLKTIIEKSKDENIKICQSENHNLTNRLSCNLKKLADQTKLYEPKKLEYCKSLQRIYYELYGKRKKNFIAELENTVTQEFEIINKINMTLLRSFCKDSTGTCKILINGQKFANYNTNLITSIEMENVAIEPGHLFQFLNKTINLSYLILKNVTLPSEFNSSEKVILPNLNKFVLDLAVKIGGKESFRQYLNNFSKFNLKSLLFFDKPKFPNWNIEDLFQLETDIHISIDSVTILKIDKTEGELTSMILFTNDILQSSTLQSSNFNLRKLFLAFVPDLDVSIFPNKITHLNLFDVGLSHGSFSDLLIKCQELIDLRFFLQLDEKYTHSIDLSELPPGLKTLTIDSYKLDYSPVQFVLNKLTLFWCHLSNEIVSNFLNIFNVNKISIHMLESDKYSNTLLTKLIKSNISEIIVNMGRDRTIDSHNEVDKLLTNIGIENDVKIFILKMETSGEFVGREFLEESQEWMINDYNSRFEHFTTFDGYKRNKIF